MNTNNKLIPHVTPTQATVVGGKHSYYCTIPAPMLNLEVKCCGEDPWLRSVHFPLPPPPGVWLKASYNCPILLTAECIWGFQTHQKFPNFIFNLHGYQPCLSVSLVATVWSCHTTCPLSAQWGRERDDIWPDKTKQTPGDLRYRIKCFLKNSLWSCFL